MTIAQESFEAMFSENKLARKVVSLEQKLLEQDRKIALLEQRLAVLEANDGDVPFGERE